MIDTVLFDLDATLVDDGPNWRRSVNKTVELVCSRHRDADADAVRKNYYAAADSVWEEIRGVEAAPWGNMDDEEVVMKVWKITLTHVQVEDADTLQQAVTKYLGLRGSGSPAFDDARDCLDRLATSYKLGIVTNGASAIQVPKLESSGLASYFQVMVTTDVGFGKPQIEIFMHALAALEATPKEAVYIGDSLSWDVGGANRAGMASVWLNRRLVSRKPEDPAPDREITSLAEVPEVLLDLRAD